MFPLYMNHLRPPLGDNQRLYWDYDAEYDGKILGYSPIAYWPLWEASGSIAVDLSGNGFHGTYSDVTLGQPGPGDGKACPFFDGSAGFVDIFTTGFRDAFDGAEGTIIAFVKAFNVGVWTDGNNARRIVNLQATSDNFARIRKSANNQIDYEKRSGGDEENTSKGSMATVDFFHVAMSWSETDDKVIYYYDGSQEGSTDTGLTAWPAVTLHASNTLIGASSILAASPWHGCIARVAVFDSAQVAASIEDMATVG